MVVTEVIKKFVDTVHLFQVANVQKSVLNFRTNPITDKLYLEGRFLLDHQLVSSLEVFETYFDGLKSEIIFVNLGLFMVLLGSSN